jgi:hypothetical protein
MNYIWLRDVTGGIKSIDPPSAVFHRKKNFFLISLIQDGRIHRGSNVTA